MQRVKAALWHILLGGIGMAVMLLLYIIGQHLWTDHTNLHALVNIEMKREQQTGTPVTAAPPTAPADKH